MVNIDLDTEPGGAFLNPTTLIEISWSSRTFAVPLETQP
jgi:hypothetical protein